MEKYKPDFFITPYELIEDESITPLAERVFSTVYYFTKMKGQKCVASNEELARIAKAKPNSVSKALNLLEQHMYIQRVYEDEEKLIRKEIKCNYGMGRETDTIKFNPPGKKKKKKAEKKGLEIELPPEINKEAWADFVLHREFIKNPLSETSAKLVINKLKIHSQADQREMVDNTLISGKWLSVFPIKKEKKKTPFSNNYSRENDGMNLAKKDQEYRDSQKRLKEAAKDNPRLAELLRMRREAAANMQI